MIRFLLQRPISVLMVFTACFIVGLVGYFSLPVSLLPDIPIPEITVQVSAPDNSARELENTVTKTIRHQLLQVAHLKSMESETHDGGCVIRLKFKFGTDTHLAFIEVNEKIDACMNRLPKETERPRVIKASAADIPVFYLSLTLKKDSPYAPTHQNEFLEMCNFAESTVRRRIEQLPEVAMADRTGLLEQHLQIVPDMGKLEAMGLNTADLEQALHANNVEPGSMRVKDGYYEYNIRFSTLLRTPRDVEDIFIRKNGRIVQFKDIATVEIVPEKEKGLTIFGGKRAVTLAIIKQADENMDKMKESLQGTINHLAWMYPDIEFHISRNQTELLDSAISNLQQELWVGFLLICLVTIWFLRDVRSPLIIGISIVTAIVISFFFFFLFGRSLNIISIAGLILALGMMIDSAIVVTENISQYRERGYSLHRACITGTSEVMTPMFSSILTTISVFIPLVFLSGIAGALFFDQAFAVSVGLLVSYFTGIILLPVLYSLFYHRKSIRKERKRGKLSTFLRKFNKNSAQKKKEADDRLLSFYDHGFNFVFRHKISTAMCCIGSLVCCVVMFLVIDKSGMPDIEQRELILRIDWNENIHPQENHRRVNQLFRLTDRQVMEQSAEIGQQDYLLNSAEELSTTEAILYYKTKEAEEIAPLQQLLTAQIREDYPEAILTFAPPMSFFERLFTTGDADLVAEVYTPNRARSPETSELMELARKFESVTGSPVNIPSFQNQLNVTIDQEKLLLYKVSYNELYRTLRTAFKENSVAVMRSYQDYLPVYISGKERNVEQILQETLLQTESFNEHNQRIYVPLRDFVRITPSEDLKKIVAGKNGEYIPYSFWKVKDPKQTIREVRREIQSRKDLEVEFSGNYFSNSEMIREMIVVLLISLLLMYFILASQFESFLQPLIVLIEIPIDVAFALILLWLLGQSLNLMSAIGIVVTCGIVINDSILKLDAINELRKKGMSLMEAIHEGGRRRLRPIIMTSLTTVFAMTPLLFSSDIGSELQKPLSISIIGAMSIGTLVSLFIVPYIYWLIYRKKKKIYPKIKEYR